MTDSVTCSNTTTLWKMSAARHAKVKLYSHLLSHPALEHGVSPTVEVLQVALFANIYHIVQVSESDQRFSCVAFIQITWCDPDLAWRPEEYAGVSVVNLPTHR